MTNHLFLPGIEPMLSAFVGQSVTHKSPKVHKKGHLIKGNNSKVVHISQMFQDEKSPSGQVMLMVDMVIASSRQDSFQVLMDILSEKYQWLVTEVQTDVRYEEGIAGVEPEVAKEAGILVHKYGICLLKKKK